MQAMKSEGAKSVRKFRALARRGCPQWPPPSNDNQMTMTRIDLWIGKTLFVPPIVKFCQWTRQSQFAVSRLFWFVAALDGLYRAETWFAATLFGSMSIVMMIAASMRADVPKASSMWFRMVALALLTLDLIRGIGTDQWAGIEFWVFVLIAEYATTIRTIPPLQDGKAASKGATAGSGQA